MEHRKFNPGVPLSRLRTARPKSAVENAHLECYVNFAAVLAEADLADVRSVRHLALDEVQVLLDVPDPTTRDGIRDRALLHIAITGGLRVSELVGLKMDSLTFRGNYLDLRILGKGRKEHEVFFLAPTGATAGTTTAGQPEAPVEPTCEILGVDLWMDADGMRRFYAEPKHLAPLAELFVAPPTTSMWERPAGTWVEW
jgi:hypothetical protein